MIVFNKSEKGFTLIELIVTIIMIGIMAAVIVPKILTSKGFEDYTYRDELITKLRSIQLRTMQQTNNNACQLIKVESSTIGLLATTLNASTCESNYAGETTSIIIDDHDVTFSISESLANFSFSSLGRPLGCVVNPCAITITVTGESILKVEINAEGYIYAL
ncbi:MAG: type II secretion system protein [Colwellia sp.]|nr:type II secretion system protein [Colwellia sp.]